MARAITHSTIQIGGEITIPISIYKASDPFSIATHRHHISCGEQMKQPIQCPAHPEDPAPEFDSFLHVGDEILPFPADVRADIVGKNDPLVVHQFLKLSELSKRLGSELFFNGVYEVAPKLDETTALLPIEEQYASFLAAMKRKRVCAVVSVGLGGMKRFGILYSSGKLCSLFYSEELRSPIFDPKTVRTLPKLTSRVAELISPTDRLLTGINSLARIVAALASYVGDRQEAPAVVTDRPGEKISL